MTSKTKKPNQTSHRRAAIFVIVGVFIIAVVAAVIIIANINKHKTSSSQNESSTTTSHLDSQSSNSNSSENNSSSAPTREKEKSSTSQYEGADPNTLGTLTGVISHASVADGALNINATLDQSIGASGTCVYTLTSSTGQVVSESNATSAGPAVSFCTISLPVSSLGSGHWDVKIEVTNGEESGIIKGEVNI